MDEFDHSESTDSMETYRQNRMACFRNVLAEALELEGDWRVALAEIIFPTSIKNLTTKEYFVYILRTPFHNSPSTGNTRSGGVMVEIEDWSNHATSHGEYKTFKDIVTRLHVAVAKSTSPIVYASTEEYCVEFNFANGYRISLHSIGLFVRCVRLQRSARSQPMWVFYW